MSNTQMTQEQFQAEIARLTEENNKLKASKPTGGIKVSEKGAVSVYGIQRFPVTLYAPQWEKLLAKCEEIKAFIEAHKGSLSMSKADTLARSQVQDEVRVA